MPSKLNNILTNLVENFDPHLFDTDMEKLEELKYRGFRERLLKVVKDEQAVLDGPVAREMAMLSKFK